VIAEARERRLAPGAKGLGDHDIEKVWWAARVLHFPKLNVSTWFEGSEIVGITHGSHTVLGKGERALAKAASR